MPDDDPPADSPPPSDEPTAPTEPAGGDAAGDPPEDGGESPGTGGPPGGGEDPSDGTPTAPDSLPDRIVAAGRRTVAARPFQVLLAVTVLGFVLRLVGVGTRIAHQDEARVAYWTLRFSETGVMMYRPIIHGPFLPIVGGEVFGWLGPSDAVARGVVAVVGGLLPLSAWLFREHLRDREVMALGIFLTLNPILVYYSRFYRSDLLVATFAFVALGLFVRTVDTGRRRYFYGAVGFLALSLTTKENALLYPVCWLGAAALLVDHRLFRARARDREPAALAEEYARRLARTAWRWRVPLVVGVVEFVAVIVFFYAPRGGGFAIFGQPAPGVDLYGSIGQLVTGTPGPFVTVVTEATLGTWDSFLRQWGSSHGHAYLPYFRDYISTLRVGALTLSGLAVVGFLVDRYGPDGPRDLVAAASYWGVASVLGYPLATDIQAPWAAVHAVVPLAIPAAVGLVLIVRWGEEALVDDDGVGVATAAVILLLLTSQVGFALYTTTYAQPGDARENQLVQYAQSSTQELKPMLREEVRTVGAGNDGTDVLFYGEEFNQPDEDDALQPPGGIGWFDRLPMAWYLELNHHEMADDPDAEFLVNSTDDEEEIRQTDAERLPPVIVTLASSAADDKDTEEDIRRTLLDAGYTRHEFQRYGWASAFVVYVDEDWRDRADVEKRIDRLGVSVSVGNVSAGSGTTTTEGPGDAQFAARDVPFDGLKTARPQLRRE